MELQEFLERFDGVQKSGGQWVARCPAHDDRKQSVSIGSDDDKIKLCCHAGCPTESILSTLQLSFSDLFFKPLNGNGRVTTSSEIDKVYDYQDENGNLLFQVVRYEPKDFRQRRPDGLGDWTWNLNGVRRVPYMLPDLVNSPDEPVFIVEGEKDVHSLRAHGYIVTTNAGGAGAKWLPAWNEYFQGRTVYLIPDRDRPGYERINKIGDILVSCCRLRLIELYGSKDITDWLKHNPVSDFIRLTEEAKPWTKHVPFRDRSELPSVDVYHGLIGEIVKLLEPHTEASPVALYIELLTLIGNCINRTPHFKVGGSYHRCNLFIVICGESSKGRKGSGHDIVVDFFRYVDSGYLSCIVSGLSSGEGAIHAVRDPVTKVNKKGELETIDSGASDRRCLFFEPELAGRTFVAMRREGSTLSSVLRMAWETDVLSVVTKGNAETATNVHISVIGHATVQEFVHNLRAEDISSGFANRFMFFLVKRAKYLPFPTYPEESEVVSLALRLNRAIQATRIITRIDFAPEIRERWEKLYMEMNAETESVGQYDAMLSRGSPQIIRMAMIHAVIDGRKEIKHEDLDIAIQLWSYSVQSVEAIADQMSIPDIPPDAQRIIDLLEQEDREMSTNEVRLKLNLNGTRIAMAVGWLLKNRMIYEYRTGGTGGRQRNMIGLI